MKYCIVVALVGSAQLGALTVQNTRVCLYNFYFEQSVITFSPNGGSVTESTRPPVRYFKSQADFDDISGRIQSILNIV